MNSIAVLCFVCTIFTVNVLCQNSSQEPLKSTSVRQTVTQQQAIPKSSPNQPPPPSTVPSVIVGRNSQNVRKPIHVGPYLVPKIRANIPRSRNAVPVMPTVDDSPYISLVNYDKKYWPQANPAASSSSDQIVDVYFDFIKNNDENNCLMRLICQIGFNRTAFGNFGEQVAGFFVELPQGHGAAVEYLEAFNIHKQHPDESFCMKKYSQCQHDTEEMMEVGNDLMKKNLTNLQLDEITKGQVWLARIS